MRPTTTTALALAGTALLHLLLLTTPRPATFFSAIVLLVLVVLLLQVFLARGGVVDEGVAHVVVWRADGVLGDRADLEARRHWHAHCWRAA